MRFVGLQALVVVALVSWNATAMSSHRETSEYWSTQSVIGSCLVPVNMGCFAVKPEDRNVAVQIADDVSLLVDASIYFTDVNGNALGTTTFFCTSITVSVPADARHAYVYVYNGLWGTFQAALGQNPCGLDALVASHGFIEAKFAS